jgi:sulfite dehydrogenase
MNDDTNRLRRRLIAGGAGALAAAGLGALSRTAFAQAATIELPIVNGKRNMVAFPEKRPLIVLTTRPP